MKRSVLIVIAAIAALCTVWPAAALAQTGPFTMTTPYVGVSVEPGQTASFKLSLDGTPGQLVDLSVAGVPDGWTAKISGGGFVLDRIMLAEEPAQVTVDIDVPAEAADGTYPINVLASSEGVSQRLDLSLTVAAAVGGGVTFEAEFPALRGPSDTTFSFTLSLSNDTSEEIQFGLDAAGPTGWTVTAQPSGESKASTVTLTAGASKNIVVDADPPDGTPAGTYPIEVQAAGSGHTVTTELSAEITGNFSVTMGTEDQRLNVDVTAGSSSDLPIIVTNTGTAPLTDLALTATPPSGWTVDFTPTSVPVIAPGDTVQITATVTPSDDAVAGDYRITMRASVPEVNDSIEIRATVQTSRVWGFVGLAIIVIAVIGLGAMFRTFGRR